MAEKLIEITRGKIVETIHRGDIAVVNADDKILYSVGNPNKITYWRSAAKPIQATNVILSGAFEKYKFSKKEIAIMCASHYAEKFHLETIESILRKINLQKENILGGVVTSLNSKYALKLAGNQVELNEMYTDCSGKHVGMLSVCKMKGYPVENYPDKNHPVQKDILKIISTYTDVSENEIEIGIDGCSVPVHALPLKNMAQAYARLSNPELFKEENREASEIIFESMTNHPEMVSGTGGFCTDLIAATNKRLIGKVGAEGVYCVGIKDKNIGIAIKIESGSMAVLPPAVISVLKQLKLISESELKALSKYETMDNLNDLETKVGEINAVFELTKTKF